MILRVGYEIHIDESSVDAKERLIIPQYLQLKGDPAAQAEMLKKAIEPRLTFCDVKVAGVYVLAEKVKDGK
jgi:hypothetical protein